MADDELCPLDGLSDLFYTDLQCQFYLGTTAYRAEAYEVAAAHWKRIVSAANDSEAAQELKTTALSTLAFLKYEGLGVEKNKPGAIDDWRTAAESGALEARRQLGWVYSDPTHPEYDLVIALAWYKSIVLLHPNPEGLTEDDISVYEDALEGIEEIESSLSTQDIDEAQRQAGELL